MNDGLGISDDKNYGIKERQSVGSLLDLIKTY